MYKPSVWAFAAAVVMTGGIAYAQDTPAERAAVRAEVPWYERFTFSHGPTESMTGLGPSDRVSQPAWTLSQRWGVTVDVRQAERVQTDSAPSSASLNGGEAAVGAYYQFTPSVRFGGQVSLRGADAPTPTAQQRESGAGIRLESAFRF